MSISRKLAELGLKLEPSTPPVGNYLPAVVEGNLIFCAGATCMVGGKPLYHGKVGAEVTIGQGYEAARISALNALQKMADVIGDVDRIGGIVKVVGHINCNPDFVQHAAVTNGASDLLVQLLGDAGKHARLSLGLSSLPNNVPFEVEIVARLRA